MTTNELKELLFQHASKGKCFNKEVRDILFTYKKAGGKQDTLVQLLYAIKNNNPNNWIIQQGADDILDMATGYCGLDMKVW